MIINDHQKFIKISQPGMHSIFCIRTLMILIKFNKLLKFQTINYNATKDLINQYSDKNVSIKHVNFNKIFKI